MDEETDRERIENLIARIVERGESSSPRWPYAVLFAAGFTGFLLLLFAYLKGH